jgi:dihydroorotate dehydrogenase (NAD+) catalytic subunit
MKPRRKAVPGVRSRRSPTVRRIRPAITPVPPATRPVAQPPAPGAPTTASASVSSTVPSPAPSVDALGGRPVRLAVDLGRGLVLANPVIAASGAYGFGVEVADLVDLPRLGGLVTRGVEVKPSGGQPAPRTADMPAGLLLGIGLQHPGLEQVLERYAATWARWTAPVIVNLCGGSAGELADGARLLDGVPGVAGIELNLSSGGGARVFALDASSTSSAVAAVRRATDLPVIAKLTAAAGDVRAVAKAAEDAGADAISAINTLPGLAVAADRGGPALGSTYGGLCGPALKPIALRVVYEVAQAVDIPVIGMGGVATVDDVLDLLAVGAVAVGAGVAALADPMLPVRLADELADACRSRGLDDVAALVGTALPARPGPASTRGAEYAR